MTLRKGIDCTSPPKGGAVALRAAGYSFICRYVSPQSWKRLTRSEIANYTANDFDLILNFESAAGNAKGGYSQGVADAHSFLSVAKSLGLNTNGITGYFSVDYDVSPSGMPTVINYLRGVASVLGVQHTGVYGSYYVVKAAKAAGVAKWLWETYAWSHGNSLTGRHIRQYSNGHSVLGVDSDYDYAYYDNIGQYGSVVPTPTPEPTPTPIASEDDDMTFQTLAVGDNVTPTVTAYLRNGGTTRYFVTSEFGDADFRIVCMRDGSWSAPVTLHVKSTDIPTLVCDANRMVEKISITRVAQTATGDVTTEGTATLTVVHNS